MYKNLKMEKYLLKIEQAILQKHIILHVWKQTGIIKRPSQLITCIWTAENRKNQHTDWISGFGSLHGLSERAETKAVLSPDSEQVLLTIN